MDSLFTSLNKCLSVSTELEMRDLGFLMRVFDYPSFVIWNNSDLFSGDYTIDTKGDAG